MTELNRAYYADFQSQPSNLIFIAVPLIVATILWNINKSSFLCSTHPFSILLRRKKINKKKAGCTNLLTISSVNDKNKWKIIFNAVTLWWVDYIWFHNNFRTNWKRQTNYTCICHIALLCHLINQNRLL